nr:MarR family transcriptional regulator [Evansella caseinilytica]
MDQAFTAAVSIGCTKLEILHHLHQNTELSQLELQRLLGLDGAAVTRHLKQLKQQQLISSRKQDQDKRFTLVSLTDIGKEELWKRTLKRRQFMEEMTSELSDSDIAALHTFIDRISDKIQ